jgi:hypothetical protein
VDVATPRSGALREGRKVAADADAATGDEGAAPNNNDPYAPHARTCAHGDIRPILPRIELEHIVHRAADGKPSKVTNRMKLDYNLLSMPKAGIDDLYKLWPSMKSHLSPQFPLKGPCT